MGLLRGHGFGATLRTGCSVASPLRNFCGCFLMLPCRPTLAANHRRYAGADQQQPEHERHRRNRDGALQRATMLVTCTRSGGAATPRPISPFLATMRQTQQGCASPAAPKPMRLFAKSKSCLIVRYAEPMRLCLVASASQIVNAPGTTQHGTDKGDGSGSRHLRCWPQRPPLGSASRHRRMPTRGALHYRNFARNYRPPAGQIWVRGFRNARTHERAVRLTDNGLRPQSLDSWGTGAQVQANCQPESLADRQRQSARCRERPNEDQVELAD
jgi:hypothetical protein